MQNIYYYRQLYEYEKQHGNIQIIKNYINGKNANLLNDFCSGKLNLPSPFLLDEIEWGLNVSNHRVKEIVYQLKATSRKFYNSLIEFEAGKYRTYFADTSATLGQKILCYLIELRLYNTGHQHALVNRGKVFLYKIFLFSTNYPNIFSGLFGVCSIFSLTTLWSICTALDLNSPLITFLFASVVCAFAITGAFSLKSKINIFEYSNITGKNLLIMRYREILTKLNGKNPHTNFFESGHK